MPNQSDDTNSILAQLPTQIKAWLQLLPTSMELLRRLAVPTQILIALLGLLLASYNGYHWWIHSNAIGARTESALQAELPNTVDQHKGLAAYLISNIEKSIPEVPRDQAASTEGIDEVVTRIQEKIEIIRTSGAPVDTTNLIEKLKLNILEEKSANGEPSKQAIIAGDESFFLFLPGIALHREDRKYKPLNREDREVLSAAIEHNPDILLDLQLSSDLRSVISNLDNKSINGLVIVQSYFITESGLILIRSSAAAEGNQLKFYQDQFSTHHNFSDRDYFWGAVKYKKSTDAIRPFDYKTEPYIDLGGNGLVQTYSKAFELANGRFGVLCVDVELPIEALNEMKGRLDILSSGEGNTHGQFHWIVPGEIVDENALPGDFDWFRDAVTKQKSTKGKSELLGKISTPDRNRRSDNILRYVIPLSTSQTKEHSRKVRLMWVRIDLDRLSKTQLWRLIYICVGFILFFATAANIIQDYLLLQKELGMLSRKIEKVMANSQSPFVRVNDNNEFVFVNKSFLDLLGYSNKFELEYLNVGARRTFRSILTEESQRIYDGVQKRSLRGESTDEYEITMIRRNGVEIRCRVHGERISFPSLKRKENPDRFGIVISWEELEDK